MRFDIKIRRIPIRRWMSLGLDSILGRSVQYNGMSQPCSWHFTRVEAKGTIYSEKVGNYNLPIQVEHQTGYGLDPLSFDLKKHWERVTKIGESIWQPKYAFWSFRNASACFRCAQAGRILKLLQPFRKKNYASILKARNYWKPDSKVEATRKIVDKWEEIASWDMDDYLHKSNPVILDKIAGHPSARYLTRLIKIDPLTRYIIQKEDLINNRKDSFSPTDDRDRWTYQLIYRILTSESISEGYKVDLWTHMSKWYNEMLPIIRRYEELVEKTVQEKIPQDWNDREITVVEASDVTNVRLGMRDSADCIGIQWKDKNGKLGLDATMLAMDHRIVSATLDSGVAINPLSWLIPILTKRCKREEFTLNAVIRALNGRSGVDLANADSFTGAVENQVSFADNKGRVTIIPQGTGQGTTGFDNTDVGQTVDEALDVINDVLAITGDDHSYKNEHTAKNVVEAANKMFPMSYPLFKSKQCGVASKYDKDEKHDESEDSWLNFILGVSRSFDLPSFDELGYERSIKLVSTKQSPSGSNKFDREWEPKKSRFEQMLEPWMYNYEESLGKRTAPFSSMSSSKLKALFYGDKISTLQRLYRESDIKAVLRELVKKGVDLPESVTIILEMNPSDNNE